MSFDKKQSHLILDKAQTSTFLSNKNYWTSINLHWGSSHNAITDRNINSTCLFLAALFKTRGGAFCYHFSPLETRERLFLPPANALCAENVKGKYLENLWYGSTPNSMENIQTWCVCLKSLVTQNSKRPHIRGNISCLGKLNQAISSLWNFCEIQPNFCLLDTFQKKAVLCYIQGFFYVLNGDLSWTKVTPGLQSAFTALKIIV